MIDTTEKARKDLKEGFKEEKKKEDKPVYTSFLETDKYLLEQIAGVADDTYLPYGGTDGCKFIKFNKNDESYDLPHVIAQTRKMREKLKGIDAKYKYVLVGVPQNKTIITLEIVHSDMKTVFQRHKFGKIELVKQTVLSLKEICPKVNSQLISTSTIIRHFLKVESF